MNHTGIENTLEIAGKNYKLSRFTRRVWQEFLTYCKTILPHPLEEVTKHLDGIPVALQQRLIDRAYEDSKTFLSVGSPAVEEVLSSLEGLAYLFWLLLKEHQPDITQDVASQLCFAYINDHGQEMLDDAITQASGVLPDLDLPQKKTVK